MTPKIVIKKELFEIADTILIEDLNTSNIYRISLIKLGDDNQRTFTSFIDISKDILSKEPSCFCEELLKGLKQRYEREIKLYK